MRLHASFLLHPKRRISGRMNFPHRLKYSQNIANLSEMITTNQSENNRHYIAYLCAPTSELRGRSDITTTPCRLWHTRASKQPLEGRRWNLQAKCPNCGNRPRLSGKNAHTFRTLEDAQAFIAHILKYSTPAVEEDDWNDGIRKHEHLACLICLEMIIYETT